MAAYTWVLPGGCQPLAGWQPCEGDSNYFFASCLGLNISEKVLKSLR
jgi:hypothetical protein